MNRGNDAPMRPSKVRKKGSSAHKQGSALLSARGIVNRFGEQLVHDDIDLDVFRGEILGIAGGSGSGKSVLLKTLAGLRQPNAGEVLLDGRPITELAPAEKANVMGMLFQQGALFSSLSVAQNVMLPMREHTLLPLVEQQRLAMLKLALTGLSADDGAKFPHDLSGGMIKRAALARALALDPRILFLDEPTSDLDPLTASGIDALLLQLNKNLGVTLVLVTHDLTTMFSVCDRLAMLVDKKIIVGTPRELKQSTQPWIHEMLHGARAMQARTQAATN